MPILNVTGQPCSRIVVVSRLWTLRMTRAAALFAGLGQQEGKFIPAEPGDHVRCADAVTYGMGDERQQCVSGTMAQFVVNGLEIVHVHVCHGKGMVIPGCPVYLAPGQLPIEPDVRCPREMVDPGQLLFPVQAFLSCNTSVLTTRKNATFTMTFQ